MSRYDERKSEILGELRQNDSNSLSFLIKAVLFLSVVWAAISVFIGAK